MFDESLHSSGGLRSVNPSHCQIICDDQHVLNVHCTSYSDVQPLYSMYNRGHILNGLLSPMSVGLGSPKEIDWGVIFTNLWVGRHSRKPNICAQQ